MAMTYDDLVAQITAYANRSDTFFTNQIPTFIQLGINIIYRDAKSIGFEQVVDFNLVTDQNRYVQPPTWRETISFQYTIPGATPYTTYLLPRTYEFCTTYWPNQAATSTPLFYANFGNAPAGTSMQQVNWFFVSPTPDQDYPGQLIFLGLPVFNAQNQTNFLTVQYPQLLLYAALKASNIFLKSDERNPIFEANYMQAIQNINNESKDRYTDRTSKKDKD